MPNNLLAVGQSRPAVGWQADDRPLAGYKLVGMYFEIKSIYILFQIIIIYLKFFVILFQIILILFKNNTYFK